MAYGYTTKFIAINHLRREVCIEAASLDPRVLPGRYFVHLDETNTLLFTNWKGHKIGKNAFDLKAALERAAVPLLRTATPVHASEFNYRNFNRYTGSIGSSHDPYGKMLVTASSGNRRVGLYWDGLGRSYITFSIRGQVGWEEIRRIEHVGCNHEECLAFNSKVSLLSRRFLGTDIYDLIDEWYRDVNKTRRFIQGMEKLERSK